MAHANISNMANYICRSTEHRTCVTVIAPNLGITFSHGAHQTLRIGSTLRLYRVKNPDGRMFTGTVARIDARDLILLEINPNIPIPEITFSNPEHGCEYFLLGLSSINQQLYVHSGTVGGIRVSRNGHFFGTSGSSPGDSGGACFDKRNPRRFLGMNVGNWTQPLTEASQLRDLSFPPRAYILPARYICSTLRDFRVSSCPLPSRFYCTADPFSFDSQDQPPDQPRGHPSGGDVGGMDGGVGPGGDSSGMDRNVPSGEDTATALSLQSSGHAGQKRGRVSD